MRQRFDSLPSTQYTIEREGGERLTFDLVPYPIGYYAYLESRFPAPETSYANGKPVREETLEYQEAFAFCLLAKCLEASGIIETPAPDDSAARSAWADYAAAVKAEFVAANLTGGEVVGLTQAATALTTSRNRLQEVQGN